MKKIERIFIVIMLIGLSYLIVYSLWKDKQIEKNAVYVLAKVYKIHNTENGLLYCFMYYFDYIEYKSSLKGFDRSERYFIASVALKHKLKLATNNWEHFNRIDRLIII